MAIVNTNGIDVRQPCASTVSVDRAAGGANETDHPDVNAAIVDFLTPS